MYFRVHGGQRVEKAGHQSPQTAVAEARLHVERNQILELDAEIAQRLASQLSGLRIEHVLGKLAAQQVLGR